MPLSTQIYPAIHDPILYAQIRCLADQSGLHGIVGKRKQTNRRIRQKGYVRIVWPNRRMAKRFKRLVRRRLRLRTRCFRV